MNCTVILRSTFVREILFKRTYTFQYDHILDCTERRAMTMSQYLLYNVMFCSDTLDRDYSHTLLTLFLSASRYKSSIHNAYGYTKRCSIAEQVKFIRIFEKMCARLLATPTAGKRRNCSTPSKKTLIAPTILVTKDSSRLNSMTSPNERNKKLFIFDFDHTLVDANTDILPFQKLEPDLLQHLLHDKERYKKIGWTGLVNYGLEELYKRKHSPEDILNSVAEAPLHTSTTTMIKRIHENSDTSAAIASDANSLYIEACLASKSLGNNFFEAGIFTNQATIDNGQIKVTPFASGHECSRCPLNMCKGEILRKLVAKKYQGWTIVYTGDGGNDFCPATQIPEHGIVLARTGFSLEKAIDSNPELVQAQVIKWKDADEMAAIVNDLFE